MNKYLLKLKEKYHYNPEFLELLKEIIKAIIIYYGEDYKKNIFKSLLECPIYMEKDTKDWEKTYIYNQKDYDLIGGMLYMQPVIKDNEIKIEKSIFIKDHDNYNVLVSSLIHEICHLVKSYNQEKITPSKIKIKSGLMVKTYRLINSEYKIVNYEDQALEELVNLYDEYQIGLNIGLNNTFLSTCDNYKVISTILDDKEILKEIRIGEFTDSTHYKTLLKDKYKLLETYMELNKALSHSPLTKYLLNFDLINDMNYWRKLNLKEDELKNLLNTFLRYADIFTFLTKKEKEEKIMYLIPYDDKI